MISSAQLSPDGLYRYRLTRAWDGGLVGARPAVTWVMLNPSTADHQADDPTIRRCVAFAKTWGYGGIEVVNLFALRATDPAELLRHADPVGLENDEHLRVVASDAGRLIVCAWGAHRAAKARGAQVLALLGATARCLRRTKSGAPEHPLYLPGTLVAVAFG